MNVKYLLPVAGVLALVCMVRGSGSAKKRAAATAGQVTIVNSFAGDSSICPTEKPGCPDHPDPAIAVGLTYVVLYNRQGLTVYKKDGSLYRSTIYPPEFWASAGIPDVLQRNATDPHAAYDIFTHRYLITQSIASQPNCGDLLAVSAADDPTKWKAINVSGQCGDVLMRVGYDKNGVYTCEHDLATNPPGSRCAAIPSADTQWVGAGNISTTHLVVVNASTGGVGEGRYAPAINLNPAESLSDPMIIISSDKLPYTSPMQLYYRKWTWTDPNTPVLSAAKTISTQYSYSMGGSRTRSDSVTVQPGSPSVPYLRGWEGPRNIQPVIDLAGNIWLTKASTIGGLNGSLGFYWFKIPISTMKVAASGVVYDTVGSSAITYGTAAIDSDGNAYFFYQQGSASEYWSHYVCVVPAGSSKTTAATLLKAGGPNPITSTHVAANTASNGTYATQSIDPSDQTKVWFYGQYANNPAPNVWVTWVSEVTYH